MRIVQHPAFGKWLLTLRDARARGRIIERVHRLSHGLWGDVKPVGEGVSELRIDYGKGYRLYAKRKGDALVILLCGGHKIGQQRDIRLAKRLAKELEDI